MNGQKIALLAEIDHPEEVLRYWTGVGTLEYGGDLYTGTSVLGKINPVSYSSNLVIQEITFDLSGIPPQDSKWLREDIRNHEAFVWLACINKSGRVVRDPKRIVKAVIDYPKYSPSEEGTVTIQLVGRSGFYTLERSLDEVHSSEDQRRLYPGDSGCDMISSLQQKNIIWKPT